MRTSGILDIHYSVGASRKTPGTNSTDPHTVVQRQVFRHSAVASASVGWCSWLELSSAATQQFCSVGLNPSLEEVGTGVEKDLCCLALSFRCEISGERSEMEAENILEDVPQAIGVKIG